MKFRERSRLCRETDPAANEFITGEIPDLYFFLSDSVWGQLYRGQYTILKKNKMVGSWSPQRRIDLGKTKN